MSREFGKPPCICRKLPPSDKSRHVRWDVDKNCPVHGAEYEKDKERK